MTRQLLMSAFWLMQAPVSLPVIKEHLDFTPIYRRCETEKVFPMLGENDLFFRMERHAAIFEPAQLVTIPAGHITGLWHPQRLRHHVATVLAKI